MRLQRCGGAEPLQTRLWPIEEKWLGVTEKRGGNEESWHHSGRGKGWTAQISPSPRCQQTQRSFVGRGIQLIPGLNWASVRNRCGCGGYRLQNVGNHMQFLLPCWWCNPLMTQLLWYITNPPPPSIGDSRDCCSGRLQQFCSIYQVTNANGIIQFSCFLLHSGFIIVIIFLPQKKKTSSWLNGMEQLWESTTSADIKRITSQNGYFHWNMDRGKFG